LDRGQKSPRADPQLRCSFAEMYIGRCNGWLNPNFVFENGEAKTSDFLPSGYQRLRICTADVFPSLPLPLPSYASNKGITP